MDAGEDGTSELWQLILWGQSPPSQETSSGSDARCAYLCVLQLGLQRGEVLGELAGLAVRLGKKTCHVVQLDLHRDGKDKSPQARP